MSSRNRNIENNITRGASALVDFLGAERVDDLKDEICKVLLDQVRRDLEAMDEYLIVYPDDIQAVVDEAVEEAKEELREQVKAAMMKQVEQTMGVFAPKKQIAPKCACDTAEAWGRCQTDYNITWEDEQ